MSLRSPLGRVLGHGSAKEGVAHWWSERITAAALVPLTIWFAAGLLSLDALDYASVRGWLGEPLNAVVALLLVPTLLWHSNLGVQVVIEDYVSGEGIKLASLVLCRFVHAVLGVAGIVAVVRIVLWPEVAFASWS
jgi:succinate dehydrogenase / fumarate reductase, membrane anchor subunit